MNHDLVAPIFARLKKVNFSNRFSHYMIYVIPYLNGEKNLNEISRSGPTQRI